MAERCPGSLQQHREIFLLGGMEEVVILLCLNWVWDELGPLGFCSHRSEASVLLCSSLQKKEVCFESRIHGVTNEYNWISSRMTNLTLFLKYLLLRKDERIKTG